MPHKRQIQALAATALFALITASPVGAQGNHDKAAGLVARLKESLGGGERLAGISGISLEAEMRRILAGDGDQSGPELSGSVRIDMQGPSHYLFVDSFSPAPGLPPVSIGSGLDGDTVWSAPLSPSSGPVLIRVPQGDPALLRDRLERDRSRLAIALLAGSGLSGVEFSYEGLAESPDGKAEVLGVKAPGGFEGRIFLDPETARPLMIAYRDVTRRMAIHRRAAGESTPRPEPPGRGDSEPPARAAGPQMKEATMFLSDYRTEDGLTLPHTITVRIEEGQTEEWSVSKVRLNPVFAADHFKKR